MYRTKSWWLQLSREFRGAHTMAPVRQFCSIFKIAKGNGVRVLKNLSYFPTLFLFVITGKNFNRQSRIYIHIYVMTCIHANLIIKPIAVTTNKLQHIPNHLLIDSLFRLKIKDRPIWLVLCGGNPPVTGVFPHRGPIKLKVFSCHADIMQMAHITRDI